MRGFLPLLECLVIVVGLFGVKNSLALVDDGDGKTRSFDCTGVDPAVLLEIQGYQDVANRIMEEALSGKFKGKTYSDLETFVDGFGNRIAGSEALENAIDYIVEKMEGIGYENIHTENVTSPKWVRGFEEAVMLKPYKKIISVLGLAMSISTPEEGITAEVIAVSDFEDLHKNVKDATGKILVFNAPFDNPEDAIKYRQRGAIEGAKLGASAVLVRSYATYSLSTPHTGLMFYQGDVQKIPAGEISIEDAELLARLVKKGLKPVVHIKLRSDFEPSIITRNSIGDYPGSERPEEFVLISGHIDSYDVGQGALDDGYGVILSLKATELLMSMSLRPKRTVRTILWTAEEVGEVPFGAAQYLEKHLDELRNNYTTFLEADSGIHNAHGLIFNGTKEAQCIMNAVLQLLAPINATTLYPHFPRLKTDIVPLMQATGVSGALLATDANKYFWAHHSAADTMTFLNPRDLDVCLAMWSVLSYVLGDLSIMLPRAEPLNQEFIAAKITAGCLGGVILAGIVLFFAVRYMKGKYSSVPRPVKASSGGGPSRRTPSTEINLDDEEDVDTSLRINEI